MPKAATKRQVKPKRGRGRPSSYRPEFDQHAYRLCLLGMTDVELAKFFGVSEPALNRWKSRHPNFRKSMVAGRDQADAKVAHKLYRRALGYSHKAVKIFCNKDGEITEAPYIEHYPPDTAAASLWLRNRQPARWRDKQEIEHSGKMLLVRDLDDVVPA